MRKTAIPCPQCGADLYLKKTWREVFLSCRACGVDYPIHRLAKFLDQELEDTLASIRCDGL